MMCHNLHISPSPEWQVQPQLGVEERVVTVEEKVKTVEEGVVTTEKTTEKTTRIYITTTIVK